MSAPREGGGSRAGLALAAGVVGVLLVLFAPIPAGLLDVLILLNFSLALLVLLLTFYAPRPVEFSTFPALLLIATLFRLALNVSATRLILSEGDAGQVIQAVGRTVVGGNYVIGMIVFLILVVVQYVVVTNGAQRVSEVAARFTLDSLPGQQMSIDADLNMGLIDADEARRRRRQLEREAAFYGAMDGASKFVKGDAIAGLVIMGINIVGGLVIGVLQGGLPWGEALRHYTLLTIGDGIVTQIPALVVAVGTGLIVTRSASDGELGAEVVRQLSASPRGFAVVGVALLGVGALPGMPLGPVLGLAACAGAAWAWSRRGAAAAPAMVPAAAEAGAADDPYRLHDFEAVEVELGASVARHVGGLQGVLSERVATFRAQFAQDSGFVIPKVRFRAGAALADNAYRIALLGERVAGGEIVPDRFLALHPGGEAPRLPGLPAREPTYGLPALWIEEATRDAARAQRCTLVDATTVLFTHLAETIRQRAAELLTRAEAERMLARLRERQPGLVEELVPTLLGVGDVQKVLQNLLREKVPVRQLVLIVEALLDGARVTKDPALLTEAVRQRLATSICNSLSTDHRTLHVLTLDPGVEERLLGGTERETGADPRAWDGVLPRLAAAAERMLKSNLVPVVLSTAEGRRPLRLLCERAIPHLRVISVAEVPAGFELRAFSSIGTS
jgi:flagellar biosynthesis protein FlhA